MNHSRWPSKGQKSKTESLTERSERKSAAKGLKAFQFEELHLSGDSEAQRRSSRAANVLHVLCSYKNSKNFKNNMSISVRSLKKQFQDYLNF